MFLSRGSWIPSTNLRRNQELMFPCRKDSGHFTQRIFGLITGAMSPAERSQQWQVAASVVGRDRVMCGCQPRRSTVGLKRFQEFLPLRGCVAPALGGRHPTPRQGRLKRKAGNPWIPGLICDPSGIRTRVTAVRGQRTRPLYDGALIHSFVAQRTSRIILDARLAHPIKGGLYKRWDTRTRT